MCSQTQVLHESDLASVLIKAVSKMDNLTKQVSSLQQRINVQSVRLQELGVSSEVSESESGSDARRSSKRFRQPKNRSDKAKCKQARMEKMKASPQCTEVSSSEDELGLRALEKRCEFKQNHPSPIHRKRSKCRRDINFSSDEECTAQGFQNDSDAKT